MDYSWSSAAAHADDFDASGVLDMDWWRKEWTEGSWAEALEMDAGGASTDALRRATYTGRPFGDREFVANLERTLGRKIEAQRGGRPRKVGQDTMQVRLTDSASA